MSGPVRLLRAAAALLLCTGGSAHVLLVARPSVALYTPLDAGASALLLNDTEAVPHNVGCAHFNGSAYCVGGGSVHTWRFSRADGSPLPPGPDLSGAVWTVWWPGNGRLANINDEWLVTCGDWLSTGDGPSTCQVLHVNASHWVVIESEACGTRSAVAEHNGSAFVVGGWCHRRSIAAVWSLRIGRKPNGGEWFQWQRHPDMRTPSEQLATASHGGYLYACGGWTPRPLAMLSDCERWHEGMHSWQSIAPMPEGRCRLHLLSVDGHLIAMGGKDNDSLSEYSLNVFDYNEAEDTWSRLHDMPNVHILVGSAVVPAP